MDHVAHVAVGLDGGGPPDERVHPNATLGRVGLAAAIDHRGIARIGRILCEIAVVAHDDDDGVVGLAAFLQAGEKITDPAIHFLHGLGLEAAIGRRELFDIVAGEGQRQ